MYKGKYQTNGAGSPNPERKLVARHYVNPEALTELPEDMRPAPKQPEKKQPEQKQDTAVVQKPSKKKEKKKITAGTVIFYSLYFLMIIAAGVAIWWGQGWLEGWLMDFEASQPDAKCQEVFDTYFANPDWAQVYDLLDSEAVASMPKEDFAAYMENMVGDKELTYTKTSAGLSGGRKYILRLDGENLGTFTLMNSVTGELEIPDWQLDAVEIFVSAREAVTIVTAYDNVVMVNGQTLDSSYIIQTTSTVAEEYLPEGIHGPRTATYYISGLLNAPEVIVTDPKGNTVAMDYQQELCLYSQPIKTAAEEIAKDAYDFVLEGTKVYFRYMLNDATKAQLREYFDGSSDTYATIVKSEDPWLQDFRTYDFGTEKIYDYCSYGEDLFSVRIAMDLNVTRKNGTIKTFSVDTTFFVERYGKSWRITEMTNVDVNQVLTQVRLAYFQDGKLLKEEMLSTNVTALQTPDLVAPEGKVLSGWFLQKADEKGNITYSLAFQPDENGRVSLPAGYVLEPMELHALFEEAK